MPTATRTGADPRAGEERRSPPAGKTSGQPSTHDSARGTSRQIEGPSPTEAWEDASSALRASLSTSGGTPAEKRMGPTKRGGVSLGRVHAMPCHARHLFSQGRDSQPSLWSLCLAYPNDMAWPGHDMRLHEEASSPGSACVERQTLPGCSEKPHGKLSDAQMPSGLGCQALWSAGRRLHGPATRDPPPSHPHRDTRRRLRLMASRPSVPSPNEAAPACLLAVPMGDLRPNWRLSGGHT